MKKKNFKIIIASCLFLLGLYIGLLLWYGARLGYCLKQSKLDQAANSAQKLILLTNWTGDGGEIIQPLGLLRNVSFLIINLNNLNQNASVSFQALVRGDGVKFNQSWQELASQEKEFFNNLQKLDQTVNYQTLNWWLVKIGLAWDRQELNRAWAYMLDNQDLIQNLTQIVPKIIGIDDNKKYTILLQNDKELRPTGGFMGSYAQLTFDKGVLIDQQIQDIYVPDGAIDGHVNPPGPIQTAFGQGWWRLRDSNWNPDFTKSAKTIAWFFDKGRVEVGDGLIAVNLSVLEEIINLLGPIYLPDYGQEVDGSSLYTQAQYEAERDFFPGSTQKKDFLQSLTNQLFIKLENLSSQQLLQILIILFENLEQKNIQANFADPLVQQLFAQNHWTGEMIWSRQGDFNHDYLFINEANLGANKANCCIDREVYQTITNQKDKYEIDLKLTLTNQSQFAREKPPKYWGGDYDVYLRIYLPAEAKLENILISKQKLITSQIEQNNLTDLDLQELGFFVQIPHKKQIEVLISYNLPKEEKDLPYQLYIAKQSGVPPYWQKIEFRKNGQTQQTQRLIDQDQVVRF